MQCELLVASSGRRCSSKPVRTRRVDGNTVHVCKTHHKSSIPIIAFACHEAVKDRARRAVAKTAAKKRNPSKQSKKSAIKMPTIKQAEKDIQVLIDRRIRDGEDPMGASPENGYTQCACPDCSSERATTKMPGRFIVTATFRNETETQQSHTVDAQVELDAIRVGRAFFEESCFSSSKSRKVLVRIDVEEV